KDLSFVYLCWRAGDACLRSFRLRYLPEPAAQGLRLSPSPHAIGSLAGKPLFCVPLDPTCCTIGGVLRGDALYPPDQRFYLRPDHCLYSYRVRTTNLAVATARR